MDFLNALEKAQKFGITVNEFKVLWQAEKEEEKKERRVCVEKTYGEERSEANMVTADTVLSRPSACHRENTQRRQSDSRQGYAQCAQRSQHCDGAESRCRETNLSSLTPSVDARLEELKQPLITNISEDYAPPTYEKTRSETDVKWSPWKIGLGRSKLDLSHETDNDDVDDDDDDDDDEEIHIKVSDIVSELQPDHKEELQQRINRLSSEQDGMKQMLNEHSKSLKRLLDFTGASREFRRGSQEESILRRGIPSDQSVTRKRPQAIQYSKNKKEGLTNMDMYVQIEQLYTNFSRMRLFSHKRNALYYKESPDTHQMSELFQLRKEKKELKEQVMSLERQLKAANRQSTPSQDLYLTPQSTLLRSSRSEGRLDCLYMKSTNESHPVLSGRPLSPNNVISKPKLTEPTMRHLKVTLLWAISDYRNKLYLENMFIGRKEVSNPFYISHRGYRAQFEAYLNGNGPGTHSCMSIFLRIVRGDFDNNLTWPVSLRVKVVLVDQIEDRNHSRKADVKIQNSFCFRKPAAGGDASSDCWGLFEFVRHEVMKERSYIKNDRILLKYTIQNEM